MVNVVFNLLKDMGYCGMSSLASTIMARTYGDVGRFEKHRVHSLEQQ